MSAAEPIATESRPLEAAIARAAAVLPTQGPLGIFVHHNTLHALQHLRFSEAVVEGLRTFGGQPYLQEHEFRAEYARGRIDDEDLDATFDQALKGRPGGDGLVADGVHLRDLWRALMLHPLHGDTAAAARWRLEERGDGHRLRGDLAPATRALLIEDTVRWLGTPAAAGKAERMFGDPEAVTVAALHRALESRLSDPDPRPTRATERRFERHRDALLRRTAVDVDDLVNPAMVRLCAAFLDQGLAYWPMPARQLGFYGAVRELMVQGGTLPAPWSRSLRSELLAQRERGATALDVVAEVLDELGVEPAAWQRYIEAVLLALPGWPGMIHMLERDPALAPQSCPPCSLADYLAVRLLHERAAIRWVARAELGHRGPLSDLRLPPESGIATTAAREARIERMLEVSQLLGLSARRVWELDELDLRALEAAVDELDELERRRMWHLAYERHYRERVLRAVAGQHVRAEDRPPPRFQIATCIDDRSESLRRHLEETRPDVETFGVAGFFGIAVYYRGLDDPHHAAMCPVVLRPEHEIVERAIDEHSARDQRRRRRRRLIGGIARGLFVGSRSMVRGWLATLGLGMFSAFPLVTRVLFPRSAGRIGGRLNEMWLPRPRTRLTFRREQESRGDLGVFVGFRAEEKVARVARVLEDAGWVSGFAPIVLVVGHGSSSQNNPHESAYDCGACGGHRGGPNARLFALMANLRTVRAGLAERGIVIPDSTVFVGAFHDTCRDSIEYYDTDDVPESHAQHFAELRQLVDRALANNALERCRRFESAPLDLTPAQALRHVETRAEHLAEPRPEYNHCTNAVAVVGRRGLTRGLFLDRRAFLVSYDPTRDGDGEILGRVLAAIGPVCAGINLEYYFSRVDNERYGCGTKLPHNVTGLLGVMNGHASDLRNGLNWQMVEIHEPMRLLTVVECTRETFARVLERQPAIRELVDNEWIVVALVDPVDGALCLLGDRDSPAFVANDGELVEHTSSVEAFRGRRDHLPVSRIRSNPGASSPATEPHP